MKAVVLPGRKYLLGPANSSIQRNIKSESYIICFYKTKWKTHNYL